MPHRTSKVFHVVLGTSLAAVATALVSQYMFDMPPCAWCVLQRMIFLVIAVVSGLAIWLRHPLVRIGLGATIVLLAASGIASALYQHFVAAADMTSCRLSLAEKIIVGTLHLDTLLPSVFGIRVGCSAGATAMLGVPYEFWSLGAFGFLMAVLIWSAIQGLRLR
ncbi:MAG TPA: disulfide bond formation protein B [Povalibacter sp.]|nr:disulfide bond formation protein B [Povalibacter sp.]